MVVALRSQVRSLAETAQEHVSLWIADREPDFEEVIEALPGIVAAYTETAAVLAADWYTTLENDNRRFHAQPVPLVTPERVENTANWVLQGPQSPESRLRSAVSGMVFDAARNTVLVNSREEGVAIVRDVRATACNKCIARATLTPRDKSSGSGDVDWEFHNHCSCMYVPIRSGQWRPPDYANEWRQRIAAARRAGHKTPEEIALWLDGH